MVGAVCAGMLLDYPALGHVLGLIGFACAVAGVCIFWHTTRS